MSDNTSNTVAVDHHHQQQQQLEQSRRRCVGNTARPVYLCDCLPKLKPRVPLLQSDHLVMCQFSSSHSRTLAHTYSVRANLPDLNADTSLYIAKSGSVVDVLRTAFPNPAREASEREHGDDEKLAIATLHCCSLICHSVLRGGRNSLDCLVLGVLGCTALSD